MDTNRCFPVAAVVPMPVEDIGTCDTVKSIRVPQLHVHYVSARGLINRNKPGVVAIALQFNNAADAQSALSSLDGWRVGSAKAPHILIWSGNYNEFATVSKLLRSFSANMRDLQFNCNIPVLNG